MNIKKIVGLVLVVAGVIVLVSKGFSYTKESHKGSLGPLEFNVKEKKRVEVPAWAGVVAVAAGVALLVLPLKRER
jgi:uncharacterized membrane protein YdcZ (DUF606 family)